MTRGGREKDRETPERRCIVTGETQPKAGLIRFVAGPDGQVVPDLSEKLPGRGFWVTSDAKLVTQACERSAFSKAAKASVKCPPELAQLVERLLVQRCIDLLGLARRAGEIIGGYAKVEELFRARNGRIAALVEASDSGPADRAKLVGYARRQGEVAVVGCLSQVEIGLAFGRESVVHAALTSGPLAARFIAEAERLGGFRVLCPPEWDAA